MSSRRNRDRSKAALPKLDKLPPVSYEEVADATYGKSNRELVNQWFGDITPAELNDGEIELTDDGSLRVHDYRLTGVGLDPDIVAEDKGQWQLLGQLLFRLDHSIQWLIGDWLLHGEANSWGRHEDIARELGYEVKTLYDYRYVARNVHFSVRTENLSFGHHKLVAHLDAGEQGQWLGAAEAGDRDPASGQSRPWSIGRMRREMLALPAAAVDAETPFERNLRRIDRELTRKKWNTLTVEERRQRYEHLRNILLRMQRWGVD